MPQHGADEGAERFVGRLGEAVGPPRWLRPVLPELVELVRRGARGDTERENILQRPRVGAVGIHADREVVHDAQLHARLHGSGLRDGQLLVDQPLQPAVEVHLGRCSATNSATAAPRGCCSSSGH